MDVYGFYTGKVFDAYEYLVSGSTAKKEVGKYKISKKVIENMVDIPLDKKNLPTAPAEGLYLNKIWY